MLFVRVTLRRRVVVRVEGKEGKVVYLPGSKIVSRLKVTPDLIS